jgi:hypothetical protein
MSFDVSRLRRADQLVGAGAVALFIFMFFFKWFGGSVSGTLPAGGVGSLASSATGWQTFTNSRWVWLVTIVVAIASVVMLAGQSRIDGPVQPSVVVTWLASLSSLLIFYRIIHHPSANTTVGNLHASYGIKFGIWLGFISALVITYGGYLQMQADGIELTPAREPDADAFTGMTLAPSGRSTPAPVAEPAAQAAPLVPTAPPTPTTPGTPATPATPATPPTPTLPPTSSADAGNDDEPPTTPPGL